MAAVCCYVILVSRHIHASRRHFYPTACNNRQNQAAYLHTKHFYERCNSDSCNKKDRPYGRSFQL